MRESLNVKEYSLRDRIQENFIILCDKKEKNPSMFFRKKEENFLCHRYKTAKKK